MPVFTGTSGDDVLTGSAGDDTISGLEGNDTISGSTGNDEITGGAGNDSIDGGGGFMDVAIFAGNRADYLISTAGPITITGTGTRASDGVDTLRNVEWARFADLTVSLGVNINNPPVLGQPMMVDQAILDGSAYSYQIPATSFIELDNQALNFVATLASGAPLPDWLSFSSATRTLSGTPPINAIGNVLDIRVTADDGEFFISDNFVLTINQARGADVNGTAADDQLFGTFRDETMIGAGGSDLFFGSLGRDRIDGGAGLVDSVSYVASQAAISINLLTGTGRGGDADGDFLIQIESIFGSYFDDVIIGHLGRDFLYGLDGNDVLDGGNGNVNGDIMSGGAGDDVLVMYGNFNEVYGGVGNDIFFTSSRIDTIVEFESEGIDEVRTAAPVYVIANNIENLRFTDSGAHIGYGNGLDNYIVGSAGYDGLVGDAGNDTIVGGDGAANELVGGTGNDTYVIAVAGDTIVEFVGQGSDTVFTTLSTYTLRMHVENLVYAGNGAFGGVGTDQNNSMIGGAGADTLAGLGGDDALTGGSGADLLIGGVGADQFRYGGGETGYDRIVDFTTGTDKIALNGSSFSRTGTIRLVSASGATANSDDSAFLYDTSTGILSYDADGNGVGAAVQLAQLNTGLTLSIGDFVFF